MARDNRNSRKYASYSHTLKPYHCILPECSSELGHPSPNKREYHKLVTANPDFKLQQSGADAGVPDEAQHRQPIELPAGAIRDPVCHKWVYLKDLQTGI